MIKNIFKIGALFLLLFSCVNEDKEAALEDFTKYVNTFIGTDGTGHTFPGPVLPFGMVQPGPDNRSIGWDYTSGYQYRDSTILGFSQTRASGTGISEFGDVLVLPFTELDSTFSANKIKEYSEPGYYKVNLDNGVQAELTCTERVAFHRYTFPENNGNIHLNLQHGLRFLTDSLVLDSDVKIKNKTTISGFCR
ncbi:MAG: glycoside hydrolase family 92 protein, partial [Bacteroidota bacterium]